MSNNPGFHSGSDGQSTDSDLLAEKKRIASRLQDLAPPAVRLARLASKWLRVPTFVAIGIVCITPYLLGAAISLFHAGLFAEHTVFWLRLNLFMVTVGAFLLLELFTYRAISSVEEILFSLQDSRELTKIENAFHFLFSARRQNIFCAAFAAPVLLTLFFVLGIPFDGPLFAFYVVYALATYWLIAGGLWVTVGLIHLADVYSRCQSLRFNLLEPLETIGVRQMSALSTLWGLCFTLEAIFLMTGLWLAPWAASNDTVLFGNLFWTSFVVAFGGATFVLPKSKLKSLVTSGKQKRLRWFQGFLEEFEDSISEISIPEIERRERSLQLLREYNEFHRNIARARVSVFDLQTTLKLFISLFVPIAVFFLQNPDSIDTLLSLLEWGGE